MRDLPWSSPERRGVHTAHRRALAHLYRAAAIRLSIRRPRGAEQALDQGSGVVVLGIGHDRPCLILLFTCPLNADAQSTWIFPTAATVFHFCTSLATKPLASSGVMFIGSTAMLASRAT